MGTRGQPEVPQRLRIARLINSSISGCSEGPGVGKMKETCGNGETRKPVEFAETAHWSAHVIIWFPHLPPHRIEIHMATGHSDMHTAMTRPPHAAPTLLTSIRYYGYGIACHPSLNTNTVSCLWFSSLSSCSHIIHFDTVDYLTNSYTLMEQFPSAVFI